MNGEVAFENEIPAVLDLVDGIGALQVNGFTFFFGELGAEQPGPVIQSLPDDRGAQAVGAGLHCLRVRGRQKGVVVLAKSDALAEKFNLHVMMPVQVVRGLKGKVGADAHGQRADHRIADVEVVVQETGGATPDDAEVRIVGGELGIL